MSNLQVVMARMALRFGSLLALFVLLTPLAYQAQTLNAASKYLLVVEHDWYKDFPTLAGDYGFRAEYEVLTADGVVTSMPHLGKGGCFRRVLDMD